MKAKSILVLLALTTVVALAVGPKIPCMLTWTDSPSVGVTGYWFYWRATNGVYSDSQRIGMTSAQKPFDLRVLGLPKGQYLVSMSATNAQSESDLSEEYLWDYTNPNKPSGVRISQQ